jgi:hypothetical protein
MWNWMLATELKMEIATERCAERLKCAGETKGRRPALPLPIAAHDAVLHLQAQKLALRGNCFAL